MRIDKFEDIKIWQEAGKLTLLIYNLTQKNKFAKDFSLKDQIRRAVISVMNNTAEGFERQGNKEFCKFLYYAKGSASEVRSMLYVALKLGYISDKEFQKTYDQCVVISKLISKFITYLNKNLQH